MTHKFNPAKKDKLLSKQRYKKLPPQKTLKELMLKKGDTVVDIGCGVGFFSLPAAEMVGNQSTVYAVDIAQEMLNAVEERSQATEINNIKTILADNFAAEFPNEKIDFILLSNVLHEVGNKQDFLTPYTDKLTNSGRIAVIEWKKKKEASGPPLDHRLSSQQIKDILAKLGLQIEKEVNLNNQQTGIVAQK